jgi:hypothetical protein
MCKGCPHCIKGIDISPKNSEDLGIELHSGSKHLVVYAKDKDGWDTSISVPINFCPICGRDLRENDE